MTVKHATATTVSDPLVLPDWAQANDKRRRHIARVVALLAEWAAAMHVPADERAAWIQAGTLHDALRDAPHRCSRRVSGG